MLERMWRKGNPLTLLWECGLVQPLWRRVSKFLKVHFNLLNTHDVPGTGLGAKNLRNEKEMVLKGFRLKYMK